MEYCAVDGEILVVVQNAKMQEPIALRDVWGFGGALVAWDCVPCLLCACFACVVWWERGNARDSVRRGFASGLIVLCWWCACKDFAKFMQKSLTFALQFAPIGLGRVI